MVHIEYWFTPMVIMGSAAILVGTVWAAWDWFTEKRRKKKWKKP